MKTDTNTIIARKANSATHMVLRRRQLDRAANYKKTVMNEIKQSESIDGMCSDATFYAVCVIAASCAFLATLAIFI